MERAALTAKAALTHIVISEGEPGAGHKLGYWRLVQMKRRNQAPQGKGFVMFFRKLMPALVLGAATLLPVVALADTAPSSHCVLLDHKVTSVTPYRVTERSGRASTQRLAGAQVNVRAEPGLTAEWLQLTIQQHLAKMQGTTMANCPLDLDNVRVQVDSAGAGFAVKIIAKNPAQAKEVLHRAQLLLR